MCCVFLLEVTKGAENDASIEPALTSSADSCDYTEKPADELSEAFCTQSSATSDTSDESTGERALPTVCSRYSSSMSV